MSRSRTVSLGTLMCARDASAADSTHVAEVRWCCHSRQHIHVMLCGADSLASLHALMFAGNEWFGSVAHGAPLHMSAALCKVLQCTAAQDLHCKLSCHFIYFVLTAHACCCACLSCVCWSIACSTCLVSMYTVCSEPMIHRHEYLHLLSIQHCLRHVVLACAVGRASED